MIIYIASEVGRGKNEVPHIEQFILDAGIKGRLLSYFHVSNPSCASSVSFDFYTVKEEEDGT